MQIESKKRLIAAIEIDGMANVYRDPKSRFCIEVNPDKQRLGNEYFKLYNARQWKKATKIARISFRKAKYIKHSDIFDDWVLANKEKKYLVEALQKQASMPYENYTNWQKAIILHNNEKGLPMEQTLENKLADLKYPKYLPIDLPMPNYLELE